MLAVSSWSLRILALFFVGAGTMHFVAPRYYVAIMPKAIPRDWHGPLVAFTGVCEILGGIGVLPAATRMAAGIGLVLLLIAVLPANVQMLMTAQARHASALALGALWVRLPLQFVIIWWVWKAAIVPAA